MTKKSILFFKQQKNLINKINFTDYSIIIPVDYESTAFLDSLKISYKLPESYVNIKDYYEIDNTAIKLGKSLWDIKNESLISFKQINIPKLYRLENTANLIKLMKKIFEYNMILDSENPDNVFTTIDGNTFDDIPKFLSSIKKINYNSLETQIKSISHFDNVPIQIKIGKKIFSINQNQFNTIKNLVEIILKKLPQKQLENHPILLIDFNVVLYQNFIEELEKQGLEVVLLNSRRPVIWNKTSLKIQLSKKYNIEYLSNYLDSESRTIIKDKTDEITTNFISVINDESFKSKLQIKNLNFANLINFEFEHYFSQKIHNSIENIELGSKLLEKDFSHLLVWAYQLPFEKIIMNLASQKNIHISAFQDGVKATFRDPNLGLLENYNDYDYLFKNFFVWGKISKNYYINAGIPDKKIVLMGSTLYDLHFRKTKLEEKTKTILFATSGGGLILDANTISAAKNYEEHVKLICNTIKKIPNVKLMIKLHPFADEKIDLVSLVRKIDPDIHIYKYEKIIDLIEKSDLVISSYSTVILESMILGKSTMIWQGDNFYEPSDLPFVESKSSLKLDFNNFETQLYNFFLNHQITDQLLENSKNFIDDYLFNQGHTGKEIAKFLNSQIKST